MKAKVIDLGECPRCHAILKPRYRNGYQSTTVEGVLFCVHCADHNTGLTKHIEWAKQVAIQECLI